MKENKKLIQKLFDIRANNSVYTHIINEYQGKEFINDLISHIREYSRLLSGAQLVPGEQNMRYTFSIEDDSNAIKVLTDTTLTTRTDIINKWECTPKPFGIEIMVPRLTNDFLEATSDESIEDILKNILYKPFVKQIEKQVINGTYFDKPLFNTTNTITGTANFAGLLLLVRALKDTTDNGAIVGNSGVISTIIDTITNEAYLTEYLLNHSIEGVPIISTKDAPATVTTKFLVGFDSTKLGLLLVPELEVKKFSILQSIDYYFQIFGFVNGGDVFNTAIALQTT
jgi:hypothetical protein